ncbi:ANL_collapsed_G0008940.mRNA.1.CDS.1 [Saccharomyces cerevisiae]|nr:ANL_collapsed_G0008940.mRNA.1.CDS.1 [Saccharomyces cerevisiae]
MSQQDNVKAAAEGVANLHLDEATGEMVSKSELKKRIKQRQVEAKKAAKKAAAQPKPASKKKTDLFADLDPSQYFETRSRQIQELRKTHEPNPYPHKFHVSISNPEFLAKYAHLKKGETLPEEKVSIAGRIHAKRESGSKLKFYVLHGDGVEVQLMSQLQDYHDPESYEKITTC